MDKAKKVTKKEMFGRLIEVVKGANVEDANAMVEFLNHEIEVVYNAIAEAGKAVTVTELFEIVKNDEIKSAQKTSALVKKLVDAGRVARTEEKNKAYFTIAE